MRTVTVRATDAAGQVFGLGKILRLQAGLMTFRADRCRFGWTQLFKANNFGGITAALNVGLRGAVTSLTTVLIAFQQRRMRSSREVLVPDFLVAGLASVGLGVLGGGRAGERGGCLRSRSSCVFLGWSNCDQTASQQKRQPERRDRSTTRKSHPGSSTAAAQRLRMWAGLGPHG